MFDPERTTPHDFLSQTATKVVNHQQVQVSGNTDEASRHVQSLRQDVLTLLSIYSPNPFSSIEGCFVGEFLSRFCQPYLEPGLTKQIQSQLSIARNEFPQLLEMNQQIARINQQLFSMDSGSTPPTTINIKKTNIIEENIVLSTFMRTMAIKRELFRKIGTTSAIPMAYTETNTSFGLEPSNQQKH